MADATTRNPMSLLDITVLALNTSGQLRHGAELKKATTITGRERKIRSCS
jgi:hypothetical protein